MALAAPNITTVQRSRFQARLDEVREVLFRDRKRRDTPPEQQQQPPQSPQRQSRRSLPDRTGTISR
jgi:hypothetical protein